MSRPVVALESIPTWANYPGKIKSAKNARVPSRPLNHLVSLYRGDSTTLAVDAIVNAANETLLGGGGIDGAIHRAAGSRLRKYNAQLGGCSVGESKLSPGFKLPSKWVISTVGPRGENEPALRACYRSVLARVDDSHEKTAEELIHRRDTVVGERGPPPVPIRSVAMCGISTGIFGYPLEKAAHVACGEVRDWLEKGGADRVERVVFVVYLEKEVRAYEEVLPLYFPREKEEV